MHIHNLSEMILAYFNPNSGIRSQLIKPKDITLFLTGFKILPEQFLKLRTVQIVVKRRAVHILWLKVKAETISYLTEVRNPGRDLQLSVRGWNWQRVGLTSYRCRQLLMQERTNFPEIKAWVMVSPTTRILMGGISKSFFSIPSSLLFLSLSSSILADSCPMS